MKQFILFTATLTILLLFVVGCDDKPKQEPKENADSSSTITEASLAPYLELLGKEDKTVVDTFGKGELEVTDADAKYQICNRIYKGNFFAEDGNSKINYPAPNGVEIDEDGYIVDLKVGNIYLNFKARTEDGDAKKEKLRKEMTNLFGQPNYDNKDIWENGQTVFILATMTDTNEPETIAFQLRIIDKNQPNVEPDSKFMGKSTFQKETPVE